MIAARLIRRSVLGVLVLGLCVLGGVRQADAHHIEHCDGHYEGYLDGNPWYGNCWVYGHWHVSYNTDTGHFVFHFHGDTECYHCFGAKESGYGCPPWVEWKLENLCGICIDYAYTKVRIDHHGHVFLRCEGYAYECYEQCDRSCDEVD